MDTTSEELPYFILQRARAYLQNQVCLAGCSANPLLLSHALSDSDSPPIQQKCGKGLVRTHFTTAIHQDISFRFSPIAFSPDLWCFTTSLEALS